MATLVQLIVANGDLKGETYSFDRPKTCLVGRAADCAVLIPEEPDYLDVSRHHCELLIDPPSVWLRDLNSTNGTFVNDQNISENVTPELVELHEGDAVRVGNLEMNVHVETLRDTCDFKKMVIGEVPVVSGN